MEEIDPTKAIQHRRQTGNRKDECLRFLSSIGIDDVYEDSVEDRVKMERLIRADQIAQSLNEKYTFLIYYFLNLDHYLLDWFTMFMYFPVTHPSQKD